MSSSLQKLLGAMFLTVSAGNLFANDPNLNTPWPVGFNTGQMNISRTLMHSYGDLNGTWPSSVFHAGIDIHESTGSPPCNEVRCVDDGYATVIDPIEIPGSDGDYQYVVIICDGKEGLVQNGWSYGHLTEPSFDPDDPVSFGELIGYMTSDITNPHVHFMWTDWNSNAYSYCNPLEYLAPSPTSGDGYEWAFNPEENTPSFEHFFLEDMYFTTWGDMSDTQTLNAMLDPTDLSGNVDFFFGVSLRGDGMTGGTGAGSITLAPQKLSWDVVREIISDEIIIDSRHVFNFDCLLYARDRPNPDLRAQQLYFSHPMISLFGNNDALSFCLTNCEITADWDGINTVREDSWNTDALAVDVTESTENPVLARYPDGDYRLDVVCYSFGEDETFPESIDDVELHNFHPALREVIISDAVTDQTYYHGTWLPDGSGLEAILDIDPNSAAQAGANLEVVLIFTEEMDTGAGIDVSLGPLDVTSGTWGSSVVSNDMWTGEVTLPTSVTDGVYTLLVSAEDTDGNSLMDPEGEGTVPGPSYDCHHALQLGYPAGVELTRSVHADVYGSPKLADVDGDGDLEIAFQCIDGWADLRGDNGYSLPGWPNDHYFSPGDPLVTAAPAFGDFSGSSNPEIIFMKEIGCNVWNASGVLQFPANWFRWTVNASPVVADLDNDSSNEFLIGRQFQTGTTYYCNLVAKESDGSTYLWYQDLGEEESVTATPSVCDVDNNASGLEVIVVTDATEYSQTDVSGTVRCFTGSGGTPRWNTVVNGVEITSAVVTGNTDDDSAIEVIVAGVSLGENQVKVLQGTTGYVEATLTASGSVDAGVSLADINQDGYNDIVLSSSGNGGTLYCWGWNGSGYSSLSGFPVSLGTWTDDGVSIADIDSDSQLELVIAGKDGNLHAINHDGTVVSGFPMAISGSNALSGQPAIGDIDGDGRLEIVFFELNASLIHCVELGENTAFNYLPWPQFQHDAQNTGYFPTDLTAPAPPTNLDGEGELNGNVFDVDLTWTLSVNDPASATPQSPTDVVSYNIYRKVPPRPLELIATLPAGTSAYSDVVVFTSLPYPSCVAYFAAAWDGVNESVFTDVLKALTGSLENLALGCPVREIGNSAAVGTPRSAAVDQAETDGCRILTDGDYRGIYRPSQVTDCVEVDLGDVFSVREVVLYNEGLSLSASPEFELSLDGRLFERSGSGNARYVRIYGAAGSSEIEVYGASTAEHSSALIEVVRSDSGAITLESVSGEELTLQVYDLMGRSVWQGTSVDQISWPTVNSSGNPVPAGVYLLRVESDSRETFTAKVVVR